MEPLTAVIAAVLLTGLALLMLVLLARVSGRPLSGPSGLAAGSSGGGSRRTHRMERQGRSAPPSGPATDDAAGRVVTP